jgi:hypothetical protein
VAIFIHVIERLLPSWKMREVWQALHDHGVGISLRTFFNIKREHKSKNLDQANEVTIDARDPVARWLWSALAKMPKGKPHPYERRIRQLIRQQTKLDPSQLDLDLKD